MAKHAPPEERRAQILDAAISCFAEKGYYEASIDDIGAVTGLSKGAIYHHFRSKREIFLALIDAWSADLLARWQRVGEQTAPLDTLARDAQEAMSWAEEIVFLSPATMEFYAQAVRDLELRRRIASVYASARHHLAALMEEARRQGFLGDIDSDLVATVLIGMFEGLLLVNALDPDAVKIKEAWREGVSAVFRGLQAGAAA